MSSGTHNALFNARLLARHEIVLPAGITVDMLSGPHLSKLRNARIAQTFHRIGAIEAWGRGTNRVIEECKKYRVEPPSFREESGFLIVTFKAQIGPGADAQKQVGAESGAESLLDQIPLALQAEPLSKAEIADKLGKKEVTGALNRAIRKLLDNGAIEFTIPDKPNSRLQRYRLVTKNKGTAK